MKNLLAWCWCAVLFAGAVPGAFAAHLARIEVAAGDHPRVDTPVCAVLTGGLSPFKPMRLKEYTADSQLSLPHQVDAGGRLWFILSGRTEPGATRTFILEEGHPLDAPGLAIRIDSGRLWIESGESKIFSYNHGFVVPPDGVKSSFIRNGYIHPMYSPSGRLVTEDFPPDHLHHKGVWFPWTHTEFEGHEVDFWNLGDEKGTVRFSGFAGIDQGPVFTGFTSKHEHVDLLQSKELGGKVALNETWDVRVWNVGGREKGYWLWDLASDQRCATDSPLKLLEYRYGGLGFRGAKEWKDDNYKALASTGRTHKNGHMTQAKWCDHSGGVDGQWCGVTIMDHPGNFRSPQSMRLWDKNGAFFCYSPVQMGPHEIRPGEPYVSRYRFFIHEGEADAGVIERMWNDFANPPLVTVTVPAP